MTPNIMQDMTGTAQNNLESSIESWRDYKIIAEFCNNNPEHQPYLTSLQEYHRLHFENKNEKNRVDRELGLVHLLNNHTRNQLQGIGSLPSYRWEAVFKLADDEIHLSIVRIIYEKSVMPVLNDRYRRTEN